jgi:hypothetical protein
MVLFYVILGCFIGTLMFGAFLLLPMNGVYMFLFEREEWRYWMKFSKNVEKFEYVGQYSWDRKSYEFSWDNYKAIVWYEWDNYEGCASVHSKDGKECFCSMFWKSKSKKFADKLICKIPTELK